MRSKVSYSHPIHENEDRPCGQPSSFHCSPPSSLVLLSSVSATNLLSAGTRTKDCLLAAVHQAWGIISDRRTLTVADGPPLTSEVILSFYFLPLPTALTFCCAPGFFFPPVCRCFP
ncbi:hypothetical protein AOLI_G00076250 [Acnodon oligacanthus]